MEKKIEDLRKLLDFWEKNKTAIFEEPIDEARVKISIPYNDGSWLYTEVQNNDPLYLLLQPVTNIPKIKSLPWHDRK